MEDLEKNVERFLNELASTIAELDSGPYSKGEKADQFLRRLKRRIPCEDKPLQELMKKLCNETEGYQRTRKGIEKRVNG